MNKVKAWCVKTRTGHLLTNTVHSNKTVSKQKALEMFVINCAEYDKDGYCFVQVEITEVKGD